MRFRLLLRLRIQPRLALAFETDATRVSSLLLAHDGSNRSFPEIAIAEGHHGLSHHRDEPDLIRKVAQIDRFYAERLAEFLTLLDSKHDADGHSILHNSMIVYGSGCSDGNRHTHSNLPVILAGMPGVDVDSAGLNNDAVVPLSPEQVAWADLIFVMEKEHCNKLTRKFKRHLNHQRVIVLGIPDNYAYMDPTLVALLKLKVTPFL